MTSGSSTHAKLELFPYCNRVGSHMRLPLFFLRFAAVPFSRITGDRPAAAACRCPLVVRLLPRVDLLFIGFALLCPLTELSVHLASVVSRTAVLRQSSSQRLDNHQKRRSVSFVRLVLSVTVCVWERKVDVLLAD
jgi:hypothetical protein